jgi:hypothetical protein
MAGEMGATEGWARFNVMLATSDDGDIPKSRCKMGRPDSAGRKRITLLGDTRINSAHSNLMNCCHDHWTGYVKSSRACALRQVLGAEKLTWVLCHSHDTRQTGH